MTKSEIIKILDSLYETIVLTSDYFIVYKSINDALRVRPQEIRISSGFFHVTRIALIQGMFIELNKIFDKNDKSYSLLDIFSLCGKCLPELRDDIKILKKAYKKISPVVENIRKQRNTHYAHHDKKYIEDSSMISEEYPISLLDIEKTIDFIVLSFNRLHVRLDNQSFLCSHSNTDDLMKILDRLYYATGVTPCPQTSTS